MLRAFKPDLQRVFRNHLMWRKKTPSICTCSPGSERRRQDWQELLMSLAPHQAPGAFILCLPQPLSCRDNSSTSCIAHSCIATGRLDSHLIKGDFVLPPRSLCQERTDLGLLMLEESRSV